MFAYFKIATLGFLLLGAAGAIDDSSSSPSADSSIDRYLKGDNDLPTQATRRQTLQARTTLLNVDIENLTPDEIIFFEDCWKEVYNTKSANNDDDTTMRSVVVQGQGHSNNNRRQLNGENESRSLLLGYIFNPPTFYFDIWTVIEISCRLCYDDDRLLKKKGGSLRGKGKKNTDMDGMNHEFEGGFCDKLREGPYEVFNDIEDCRVVYMAA
jgi:hypothetical protein